jgi:hypothetical protein|tara:strand:- start:334 stop:444 length:111 start_codon:yes stop_codon:yes gene_type:complete
MLNCTLEELEKKMTLSEFTGWLGYLEEKNRQIKNGN